MRTKFLGACVLALACLVGTVPLASAQPPPAGAPALNPNVAALLGAYPTGGPVLRALVAQAVEKDPDLAGAFVLAAHVANPAQRQAIGAGLADAAAYFAQLSTPQGGLYVAQIQSAMQNADPETKFAFRMAEMPALTQTIPYFNVPGGMTTNSCIHVSPSSPASGLPHC